MEDSKVLIAAVGIAVLPLGLLIYEWAAYWDYLQGGATHTRREADTFADIVSRACVANLKLRVRFMGETLAVPARELRCKLRSLYSDYWKSLGCVPKRVCHGMYTPALHDIIVLDEKAHDFATGYSAVARTLEAAGWALLAGGYLLIGAFVVQGCGQEPHCAWVFTIVAITWATLSLWVIPLCSPVVLVFVAWLAVTFPLGPFESLLRADPAPYHWLLSTNPFPWMLLWMTPLLLMLAYAACYVHSMVEKEAELREDFLAWLYRMLPRYRVPRGQA